MRGLVTRTGAEYVCLRGEDHRIFVAKRTDCHDWPMVPGEGCTFEVLVRPVGYLVKGGEREPSLYAINVRAVPL